MGSQLRPQLNAFRGPVRPPVAGAMARTEADRREIAMERCRREIREADGLLRAGHCDVEGLCRAMADWSSELRRLRGLSGGRAS
jgi:hypothetical protein